MSTHSEVRIKRGWLRPAIGALVFAASTAAGLLIGNPSAQAIGCDITISGGTHPGLTATDGTSVCIYNAKITGGVTITNGATLYVTNSVIKGSVSANSAVYVTICGSTLASVSVTNTITIGNDAVSGRVEIGDPGDDCAPNHIQGSLTVANNNGGPGAGAWVECNRIGGSWLVVNNSQYNVDYGNHHTGSGPSGCRITS
jgi:hypothetical protein